MPSTRAGLRQYAVALRAMLVLTVVLGVAYPALVTGVGQLAFASQANGSLLTLGGTSVGSRLIGQSFTDADGAPLPQWFQSRPSAAGDGYDASASSGSNLGPNSADLIASIEQRRAEIAAFEGVDPATVPADALTASASGLDPDISPAYAELQVARVAAARGLPEQNVRSLVRSFSEGRDLGFLGDETVDVLELNAALTELKG